MSEKQNGKKSNSTVIVLLSIVAIAAIVLAVIGFMGQSSLSKQVDELTVKSEALSTQIADYKQQKQAAEDAAAQAAEAAAEVEAAKAAAEAEAAAKAEAEAAAAAEAAAKAEAEAAAKAEAEAAAAAEAAAKAEAEAAAKAEAEAAAAAEAAAKAEAEAAAKAEAEAAAAAEAAAKAEAEAAAAAEAAKVEAVAFLLYADGSYTHQYLHSTDEVAFTAANATVTGPGTYTASLTFSEPVEGLSLLELVIVDGEALLPNAIYEVTEVKVDGVAVALGKTYTFTKNGITTRNNIFNEWAPVIPSDARMAGAAADYTSTAVNADDFASYQSIEVTFTLLASGAAM